MREQLEDHVGALVSGNFCERLSRRRGVWLVEYDIPGVASGSNEVEYVVSAQGGEWFSSLCGREAGDPLQYGSPGTVEWSAWPRQDDRPS